MELKRHSVGPVRVNIVRRFVHEVFPGKLAKPFYFYRASGRDPVVRHDGRAHGFRLFILSVYFCAGFYLGFL